MESGPKGLNLIKSWETGIRISRIRATCYIIRDWADVVEK